MEKVFGINQRHEFPNILCGRLRADNFVHAERKIDVNVMIIAERGVFNIEVDGERFKVRPGEMIILPAGLVHKGFADDDTAAPLAYFWAHFLFGTEHIFEEDAKGNMVLPMYFKLTDFNRVSILCSQLLDIGKTPGVSKKYGDFLFSALCCEIAAQYAKANVSGNVLVNKIAAWIEKDLSRPLSLNDAAEAFGYNKRYISRLFKMHMGMTVNEFIIEKKLTLAKRLLTGSDESVTSIASALGCGDAGYFMRMFKKHTGMTCMQYRNAYSKMYVNER